MESGHEEYRKGFWKVEEDRALMDYVKEHGIGKWNRIAKVTGLKRCGKSCRLRWMNYLSPNVKRGDFSKEEEDLIIRLHKLLGNRWSLIAGRIPGRTDNQVKNYWNTHLSKKFGVKKEKSKVRAPPKAVPEEPKDSCNSTSNGTRQLEYNGEEGEKPVQANSSGGDPNFTTSTHEVIMSDDFGSSFWFANSELNMCNAYLTKSLQEYLALDWDSL